MNVFNQKRRIKFLQDHGLFECNKETFSFFPCVLFVLSLLLYPKNLVSENQIVKIHQIWFSHWSVFTFVEVAVSLKNRKKNKNQPPPSKDYIEITVEEEEEKKIDLTNKR